MPKMVCVPCSTEYRPERNEIVLAEMAKELGDTPYKLWMADLWKCPGCGHEVVAGLGSTPVAEHYEDKFSKIWEEIQSGGKRIFYEWER